MVPEKLKRTKGQEIAVSIFATVAGASLGLVVGLAVGAPALWMVAGAIVGVLVVHSDLPRNLR